MEFDSCATAGLSVLCSAGLFSLIMESDRGSAYKAASFKSFISHRFRIPMALFHSVHPCPGVRGTGHMERARCLCPAQRDVFITVYKKLERLKERGDLSLKFWI